MKNNNKGFTLMEMLIVVAIIAVLVAIAIPTMNNALEKAREAADEANIRTAYAQIMADAMCEITSSSADKPANTADITYNYPADKNGAYSATIKSTQKKADWASGESTVVIGGMSVPAKTNGATWTITYNTNGTVSIS